jgi:hypothetical protein
LRRGERFRGSVPIAHAMPGLAERETTMKITRRRTQIVHLPIDPSIVTASAG